MSTNYGRRVAALEAGIGLAWTPEVLEMAHRIAGEENVSADELMHEVEEAFRAIGYPHTVERMAAYYARRDGVPYDDVVGWLAESTGGARA